MRAGRNGFFTPHVANRHVLGSNVGRRRHTALCVAEWDDQARAYLTCHQLSRRQRGILIRLVANLI